MPSNSIYAQYPPQGCGDISLRDHIGREITACFDDLDKAMREYESNPCGLDNAVQKFRKATELGWFDGLIDYLFRGSARAATRSAIADCQIYSYPRGREYLEHRGELEKARSSSLYLLQCLDPSSRITMFSKLQASESSPPLLTFGEDSHCFRLALTKECFGEEPGALTSTECSAKQLVEWLQMAASYKHGSAEFYEVAGAAFLQSNEYEKAGTAFRRAAQACEQRQCVEEGANLYVIAGDCFKKAQKIEAAITCYRSGNAFEQLGACYYENSEFFESGIAYADAGKFDMAGRSYETAGEFEAAGDCYFEAGKAEDARRCYQKAKKFVQAGDCYRQAGMFGEAGDCYKKEELFVDAGDCYDKAQKFQEASDCYRMAGPLFDRQRIETAAAVRLNNLSDSSASHADIVAAFTQLLIEEDPAHCTNFVLQITASKQKLSDLSDYELRIGERVIIKSGMLSTGIPGSNDQIRSDYINLCAQITIFKVHQSVIDFQNKGRISPDSTILTNIETMSDSPGVRQLLKDSLDNPDYSSEKLVEIDFDSIKSTFLVKFKGGEIQFSNRKSSNAELRGSRLHEELQRMKFDNLRELCVEGYGTENDVNLQYATTAAKFEMLNFLEIGKISDASQELIKILSESSILNTNIAKLFGAQVVAE
ncbi:hypothetical protein PQR05_37895 [Paraburkholderia sediminicola]|uniref:hypothetical protein n=1 Tax=Paraburkholderia sediminicola TaxID=458836 RepID=UPI0038B7B4D6